MASAGSIFVDLLLRDAKYTEGWKRAGNTTKRGGMTIRGEISGIITSFNLMQKALTAAVGAGGLTLLARNAINAADALGETSKRIGVSAEELQKYTYAAKLSGLEIGTLETGLRFLNRQIAEGKLPYDNLSEAIEDVAERAKNAASPIERTGILVEAFGARAGAAFTEFTEGGASRLRELGLEAEALGIVLDESLIQKASDVNDTFDIIGLAISRNFQKGFLEEFDESYTQLVDKFQDPAVINGIQAIGAAVANLASIVGKAISNLVGLAGAIDQAFREGEERRRANVYKGLGIRDPRELYNEKAQAGGFATEVTQGDVGVNLRLEYEQKYGKVIKQNAEAYESYADRKKKADKEMAESAKEAARLEKERQQELEQFYESTKQYFDGLTDATADYTERLGKLQALLANGKITNEEYALGIEQIGIEYDESARKAEEWGFDIEAMGKRAAENVQDAFADFLFDPMEDGFQGMLKGFVDVVRKMIAEAAAAQLAEKLFGGKGGSGGGGFLGDIFGSFGGSIFGDTPLAPGVAGPVRPGIFGGFFADGGYLSPGQWGIAGEEGAEMIYGGRSGATVIPADGMNKGNNYVFNVGTSVNQEDIARLQAMILATAGPGKIEARVRNAQIRGNL